MFAALGLGCCTWPFSGVASGGVSLVAACRLLTVGAYLTVENGLWGTQASVVTARGLSNCHLGLVAHSMWDLSSPIRG